MKSVTIKPAKGKLLRNPLQGFAKIPEEGAVVPYDRYWIKRLKQGDATQIKEIKKVKAEAKTNVTSSEGK